MASSCLPAVWGSTQVWPSTTPCEWDPSGPCWCSTTSCNTGGSASTFALRSHEVLGRSYLRSFASNPRPLLIRKLSLIWASCNSLGVHCLASIPSGTSRSTACPMTASTIRATGGVVASNGRSALLTPVDSLVQLSSKTEQKTLLAKAKSV